MLATFGSEERSLRPGIETSDQRWERMAKTLSKKKRAKKLHEVGAHLDRCWAGDRWPDEKGSDGGAKKGQVMSGRRNARRAVAA